MKDLPGLLLFIELLSVLLDRNRDLTQMSDIILKT